ncbi:hypothetical protein J7E96_28220 [Streptomyces sp. ISL-96]|uniref:hypothetical protein n=1 Tax=Streptomyces sp. ISL-96 TaxID=2819191 RepID=UPI001BE97268|nr:hypothetical protein [Streptomyces sp. ISL-96]MBT2492326.1 hypothetical protein [Streptomyces sp. ISL-96]
MTMETFGPEYVRPAARACSNCACCTARLCEKGATSILECLGHTASRDTRETVAGCPCSSEETRGTAAWRAGKMRATLRAELKPLPVDVEAALRAVAAGEAVAEHAEQMTPLTLFRYVGFIDSRPAITELGATYLAARDEPRFTTPVEVELVDVTTRTARVIVVGWSLTEPVTVLLDQLTSATGLKAEELPGRFLEATANCYTEHADDLVLTTISLAPPLPSSWTAGDIPLVQDEKADADQPEGRVDGASSGGEA